MDHMAAKATPYFIPFAIILISWHATAPEGTSRLLQVILILLHRSLTLQLHRRKVCVKSVVLSLLWAQIAKHCHKEVDV